MMTFAEFKDVLEAASYVATIIGIPVATLIFLNEKRKERSAREVETYVYSNEKYIEFLKLCLEHSDLDCFDCSSRDPDVVATGLDVKKLALLTILISTLETGFLLYRRHNTAIKTAQWKGWHEYMTMWAHRPDFRAAWPVLGPQFDADFTAFMQELLSATKPTNMPVPDNTDLARRP